MPFHPPTIKDVERVFNLIASYRFNLGDEKKLQADIASVLEDSDIQFEREKSLDDQGIIDFFFSGIGVEIKIKGQKRAIYKQCKRYCDHEDIHFLILVTNVASALPEEINGKRCFVLSLGDAHL